MAGGHRQNRLDLPGEGDGKQDGVGEGVGGCRVGLVGAGGLEVGRVLLESAYERRHHLQGGLVPHPAVHALRRGRGGGPEVAGGAPPSQQELGVGGGAPQGAGQPSRRRLRFVENRSHPSEQKIAVEVLDKYVLKICRVCAVNVLDLDWHRHPYMNEQ